MFLNAAGIKAFGASVNKTEAEENNRTYVNCGDRSTFLLNDYTILSFKASNESGIEQINNGCYVLNVANCDIMNVTERFMLGVYAHSQGIYI